MHIPHLSRFRDTILVSAVRLKTALGNGYDGLGQYLSRFARELSTCRECGRPVKVSWDVCEHCGAGKPVMIDVSPSVFITAVCCQVTLLLI